jgi:hypothetical protein
LNPPEASAQHYSAPQINQAGHPPPINTASHPVPHYENKPPLQPYGEPQQQWGQVSFDEKFKPPSSKPKWNDVHPITASNSTLVMGSNPFLGGISCVRSHVRTQYQCIPSNLQFPRQRDIQ